ncbi:hypothetical protein HOE37_01840 [Candidatus Woesearchaeota archaeon]|jgi:hypothetical protein|nr:hypothetical protein [Candidatus Woesearchaeota archaeon]MBT4110575.1 hypothetical protein [Candidatus Woesearchaeota archaeon]MBT4335901.1 hypothetical protein [Candidatus Woesearchaeota archaeon]MBT4469120.1 hypothetical protein [Candidatus Woesearchaeota archaeon]MBT6744561.1 hypothetical protein [Candidatus Woesearchaeota archaeon]
MVNNLLSHYKVSPKLEVKLTASFPLSRSTGIQQAYNSQEPDWDLLFTHWGKEIIYINPNIPQLQWREICLATHWNQFEEAVKKNDKLVLDGRKIDGFSIQAQRKGALKDLSFLSTANYCFTLTDDDQHILMGVRGGSDNVGQAVTMPLGVVSYPSEPDPNNLDPITASVYSEANEEGGILPNEYSSLNCIGTLRQEQCSTPVNNLIWIGRLKITGEEIIERHKVAIELYNKFGNDSENILKARMELRKRFLFNPRFPKDAWENSRLNLFSNDPEKMVADLSYLIDQGKEIKHGLYGALALYILNQHGDKYYSQLMNIPQFKEKIHDQKL